MLSFSNVRTGDRLEVHGTKGGPLVLEITDRGALYVLALGGHTSAYPGMRIHCNWEYQITHQEALLLHLAITQCGIVNIHTIGGVKYATEQVTLFHHMCPAGVPLSIIEKELDT